MQIKYFRTAWNDIKNSEGWFGKLCLLALVGLIPIFGQIVILGYLYGWAREIAWGVHEPLPSKVFGNEDGKLYRRGWFILVVVCVFAIIPVIVTEIGSSMQGTGIYALVDGDSMFQARSLAAVGGLVSLVGFAGALVFSVLGWVASMRVAIYDRLSAGFQLGKIWRMFRHDTGGALRILGMNLLVSLIAGIVLSIVATLLIATVLVAGLGVVMNTGFPLDSLEYMTEAQALRFTAQLFVSSGVIGLLCLLFGGFVASVCSVFTDLLVARAMGYWTLQFDVPQWRGKDDPMPFELNG